MTAGGVTQLREQNGGYHRWSQDSQRLRFGLTGNQTVNTLRIEWPSGRIDTFSNVAANRLYKANEGGTLNAATLGPPCIRRCSLATNAVSPLTTSMFVMVRPCCSGAIVPATPGICGRRAVGGQ